MNADSNQRGHTSSQPLWFAGAVARSIRSVFFAPAAEFARKIEVTAAVAEEIAAERTGGDRKKAVKR